MYEKALYLRNQHQLYRVQRVQMKEESMRNKLEVVFEHKTTNHLGKN